MRFLRAVIGKIRWGQNFKKRETRKETTEESVKDKLEKNTLNWHKHVKRMHHVMKESQEEETSTAGKKSRRKHRIRCLDGEKRSFRQDRSR